MTGRGWWLGGVLMLAGMLLWARVLADGGRPPIDFRLFFLAGEVVASGESPYRGELGESRRYFYPVGFAHAMALLVPMGREAATALWRGATLLCFAALVAGPLVWVAGWLDRSRRAEALFLGAAVAVAFTPALFGYRLGQVDLIQGALLAAMFLAPGPWRPWVAGTAVALAMLIKLSPLLMVPALALAFGWRFVLAWGAVLVVYTAVVAATGWLGEEVFAVTSQVAYHQYRAGYPACSLHALIALVLFPGRFVGEDGFYGGWMTTLVNVLVLGAYAAAGLWLWWRRAPWFAFVAVAVAFSHWASPFLEPHHYTSTLLCLPVLVAVGWARGERLRVAFGLAAAFLGLVYLAIHELSGTGAGPFAVLLLDPLLLAALVAGGSIGDDDPTPHWCRETIIARLAPTRN